MSTFLILLADSLDGSESFCSGLDSSICKTVGDSPQQPSGTGFYAGLKANHVADQNARVLRLFPADSRPWRTPHHAVSLISFQGGTDPHHSQCSTNTEPTALWCMKYSSNFFKKCFLDPLA